VEQASLTDLIFTGNRIMVGLNHPKTCREKLKDFISRRTTPAGLTIDDGIRYWQERFLLVFVFVGTFFGFFVYLPSVALSIKEGLWSVAVADTIIYGWVVILFFVGLFPLWFVRLPFPLSAISSELHYC